MAALVDARREAEDLMRQFQVIHPDDRVVRSALQGMADSGLWPS